MRWFEPLVCAILFYGDRWSKAYMLATHSRIPITINKWLSWDVVINKGISWGMLSSYQWPYQQLFLGGMSVLIVALVILSFYEQLHRGLGTCGHLLVIVGAISNLMDRYLYGGVVDFIRLSYGSYYFPIFNGADVYIVLGVVCMVFASTTEAHKT